jgi:uncharacterized protein YjbI with pentapeptide repeats
VNENPDIRPDLSGADLIVANLSKANLSGANLFDASLIEADLSGANLVDADLTGADLLDAHLSGADLSKAELTEAILREANLIEANLTEANLIEANLTEANLILAELREADLSGAHLIRANLSKANLIGADLDEADLTGADLSGADLSRAVLCDAKLSEADLRGANLSGADLSGAVLRGANLMGASLCEADLRHAALVNTDLTGADITGCRIYGISAWRLKLDSRTEQQNLIITDDNEPAITVDKIEVAQFIYLLLHNEKIRDVIDTIISKAVLILGRFTEERKAVLDALREELRKHDYLPILFDFNVPATRDITETVSLLARMARFIIADLTDPSSIPKELEAIVPTLAVPVQPLLEGSSRSYAMFKDYWKYDWVLPVYRYDGIEPLLATLAEKIIAPAEGKVKALEERRRMIEAELTKPQ